MATTSRFVLLQILLVFAFNVTADTKKEIDLTWPYNDKSISWGKFQKFTFTRQIAEYRPNGQWYSANELAMAEHSGTHLDAPYHFDKNGWKVGDIPLTHLLGNGVKIDISNETEKLGHAARLLPKHLIDWEERNGPIPQNSIILVYFNWGKYYHDKPKYMGGETTSDYKFPSISPEAAQWIVDAKKVFGVGLDAASVDPGNSPDAPVHSILLKNKIYNLENVKIPKSLPEKGFWLSVMPMHIEEGTGAPVRIVAYSHKHYPITF